MKIKILVAGRVGYIESHASVLLLEQGHNVMIIDDLCNSKENAIENIKKTF